MLLKPVLAACVMAALTNPIALAAPADNAEQQDKDLKNKQQIYGVKYPWENTAPYGTQYTPPPGGQGLIHDAADEAALKKNPAIKAVKAERSAAAKAAQAAAKKTAHPAHPAASSAPVGSAKKAWENTAPTGTKYIPSAGGHGVVNGAAAEAALKTNPAIKAVKAERHAEAKAAQASLKQHANQAHAAASSAHANAAKGAAVDLPKHVLPVKHHHPADVLMTPLK